MKKLCEELKQFFKVKDAWWLGSIQVRISKCSLRYCPQGRIEGTQKHMVIIGCHLDKCNVRQKEFLGYGYNDALARMKYVKYTVEFDLSRRVTGTDCP